MFCGFGVFVEWVKWGVESLALCLNWFLGASKNPKWTSKETNLSETPLLIHDSEAPDRCHKVANMILGKKAVTGDVSNQYNELVNGVTDIEAGLTPIPHPSTEHDKFDELKQSYGCGEKQTALAGPSDHERTRGVPWTEDEHKLFLLGLKKYGKGDWRNISRNFVITKTPTQVASHAQKYYSKQRSEGKKRKRSNTHP